MYKSVEHKAVANDRKWTMAGPRNFVGYRPS